MALVRTEVTDGVAVLTLDDPPRRNAVSAKMNAELVAAVEAAEDRTDVGALVLTGTPPAFCAGADLDELADAAAHDRITAIYAGFLRVAHSLLPTVAAVNGPAVGAGMNMALACDVIVAGRSARFDPRFLALGVHPGGGHTWRLRRLTDHQTVMAMVVFGEALDGEAAERRGLAWRCVPDDELLEEAARLASRAAAAPSQLVRRTKATITDLDRIVDSEGAVAHEIDAQVWSMHQEAFGRLVASRRPSSPGGSP